MSVKKDKSNEKRTGERAGKLIHFKRYHPPMSSGKNNDRFTMHCPRTPPTVVDRRCSENGV